MSSNELIPNGTSTVVNNRYHISRRIGGGSFGEIYLGVGPNNEKVAVKYEKHGSRCPQLRHEYKVYRELHNSFGFCNVHYFGIQDNFNVMVMDLLGPSLEDLFNQCDRKFSLKTVLQLADQLLERADTLHSRHLIHRDIKPANFVIGIGEQGHHIVYCVDFGLSKRFRHPKTLQHIPHRDGRSLTGTPRYASINNHLGIEQSRRDDLESIGYVLVYFLKGVLPWQGLKAKNAQKKYQLILQKKQQVSVSQLCAGCPTQFAEFLAYTRALKFDTKPDMQYLRRLFRDLFVSQGYGASGSKAWDWENFNVDYLSPAVSSGAGVGEFKEEDDMIVDDGMADADPMEYEGDDGDQGERVLEREERLLGVGKEERAAWSEVEEGGWLASAAGQLGESAAGGRGAVAARRPQSANMPVQKATDAHMVAGARAMMRFRRTSRGSEGAAPSSPTAAAAPKMIFQNPSKQHPIGTRKSSEEMPWAASERATKSQSSSRGGLKDAHWAPSVLAAPAAQEDPSALGIGKQFVTKVKSKASNMFTLTR